MEECVKKPSVSFMNIRFDLYDMEELIDLLIKREGHPCTVITPNLDHVVRTNKDNDLLEYYNSVDFCVNDSRILQKMAKLFGLNLGTVIPGSDLTRNIIDRISGKNTPVTIIGCNESTVESIRDKFKLQNITHYNPPMGFIDDNREVDKCIETVLRNRSHFVFLAVGSPRQEILAKKITEKKGHGVVMCIGASLQFLSGEEVRAPLIMQKLSLEWLFRLLQSPKRLAKRYLIDSWGVVPLLIEFRKRNKNVSSR